MSDIGLNEANFLLFAAQHYDSIFPDTVEFIDDLKRFAYVKRLFNQYKEKGVLKERLILNHIIIIFNMWGSAAIPMLFLKMSGSETCLKTILTYMQLMPDKIENIGLEKNTFINKDIPIDTNLWNKLKDL